MISDIQAQHYLFEIVRETELGARLFRKFQTGADKWLQVDHATDADGRTLWTGIEAERDMEEAIEGLLSSFARISLFFFPDKSIGAFGEERGSRLRELASIVADHPIGNRKLRNHWMHLDHRFDAFVQSTGTAPIGYYLDRAHRISDSSKRHMLRLIDPSNQKVFVLGEEFELCQIASAIEHVGQQAALAIVDSRVT
jgi:hypothetical protein